MKSVIAVFLTISFSLIVLQACKTKEESAANKAKIAAAQGAAIGQFKLGKMYAIGSGVPEDKLRAFMWANLADAQGLGDSVKEFKAKLTEEMTEEQIASAEKMSEECKTKGYKDC